MNTSRDHTEEMKRAGFFMTGWERKLNQSMPIDLDPNSANHEHDTKVFNKSNKATRRVFRIYASYAEENVTKPSQTTK